MGPRRQERALTKSAIRERVWRLLETRGVGRFPLPLSDRIPNFAGAERAAARLGELPEWKAARRLKVNPDAPQRPVRLRALREGKHVFMAVPRLRTERCFLHLDPAKLAGKLAAASTIKGASLLGTPVKPRELALAREIGAVGERTPVVTTVHELQVLDGTIPMTDHDVPLDIIATPERLIRTRRKLGKPRGILWPELARAQLDAMPVLQRLRVRSR